MVSLFGCFFFVTIITSDLIAFMEDKFVVLMGKGGDFVSLSHAYTPVYSILICVVKIQRIK